MRILLIDDDETNARFLQILLTKAVRGPTAFEVLRVDRLFDGLQQLDEPVDAFDAILLDLGLPECGGLTTLKLVHAHAPAIPIVVVTGLDNPETASEAITLGAGDYLVKGRFDAARLERALVGAIEARRSSGEKTVQSEELKGEFLLPDPT
jgi:DNA-binding NtrC family response regulator